MTPAELRERQAAAWRMLGNDLAGAQVSHAYLFAGPPGSGQAEAARLFAASLVCADPRDGWACGECAACRRVAEGSYADIRVIDGGGHAVKKEAVRELEAEFAGTALEAAGRKAYIINGFEDLTASAMNALLKFLEEPGQEITAILCSENPERILATVLSRCKLIPFHAPSPAALEKDAAALGLNGLDAHILAYSEVRREELIAAAGSKSYQAALAAWLGYLERLAGDPRQAQFYLEAEAFDRSDKGKLKETFGWFLRIGEVYAEDWLAQAGSPEPEWQKALSLGGRLAIGAKGLMMILLECRDGLTMNANTSLLIDRLGYGALKEEAHA